MVSAHTGELKATLISWKVYCRPFSPCRGSCLAIAAADTTDTTTHVKPLSCTLAGRHTREACRMCVIFLSLSLSLFRSIFFSHNTTTPHYHRPGCYVSLPSNNSQPLSFSLRLIPGFRRPAAPRPPSSPIDFPPFTLTRTSPQSCPHASRPRHKEHSL